MTDNEYAKMFRGSFKLWSKRTPRPLRYRACKTCGCREEGHQPGCIYCECVGKKCEQFVLDTEATAGYTQQTIRIGLGLPLWYSLTLRKDHGFGHLAAEKIEVFHVAFVRIMLIKRVCEYQGT
jgi:hypothetical protein